jgi:hypothetical protein
MTELRTAILAAGAELGDFHQWLFEDGADAPEETSCFVEVLEKHLAPLLDPNFKARRIAILEAELAALRA